MCLTKITGGLRIREEKVVGRSNTIGFGIICVVLLAGSLGASAIAVGDMSIHIDIPAVFRQDTEGKWRCYANVTIQNTSEGNITLMWVCFNLVNITFVDETSEDLSDLHGYNLTVGLMLKPEDSFILGFTAAEFGFEKEPRIIWVRLESSYLEAEVPLACILSIVSECPLSLILLLFVISTLLAAIIRRKISDHSWVAPKPLSFG